MPSVTPQHLYYFCNPLCCLALWAQTIDFLSIAPASETVPVTAVRVLNLLKLG